MVDKRTPLADMKQLESMVLSVLRGTDLEAISSNTRQAARELKQLMSDARLDVRDAEYAETIEEYRRYATVAKSRLDIMNKTILLLSQNDIFSPIEIAEIGSRLDTLKGNL